MTFRDFAELGRRHAVMCAERFRTGQHAVPPTGASIKFQSIRVSMTSMVVPRRTKEPATENGRPHSVVVACLDAERIHRDDRRPRPP